jgi:hypothetical protein
MRIYFVRILVLIIFLFSRSILAQISTDEPPISTRPEIKQWLEAKSLSYDIRNMSPVDLKKIKEEDEAERSLGVP